MIYIVDYILVVLFHLYLFDFHSFYYLQFTPQGMELSKIIYEKGCVQAGEEWIEHNLIIISTVAIGIMFFQVFSFCQFCFEFNRYFH